MTTSFSPPSATFSIIAIDGPAASGKSTVAKLVARKLGSHFINSGSLYRAMTFAMLAKGIDVSDTAAIAAAVGTADMTSGVANGFSHVAVAGQKLEAELESSAVNAAVSKVARVQEVRDEVVKQLRAFACNHSIVMEGRDIGSVVFPHTPWKFYIDANAEVRQQRRLAQGQVDSVRDRDHADSSRVSAPLVIPEGAEIIDSSYLTPEAVVDCLISSLQARAFPFPES